jgi:hypothetical protein
MLSKTLLGTRTNDPEVKRQKQASIWRKGPSDYA